MAAALFLAEPVGWRRWNAIGVGFVGVMIIVRPGLEGFSIYSLSALFAIACITLRDIATRRLSSEAPSLFVALITAIAITGLGAVMVPSISWVQPTGSMWLVITGASVAIIFGYLFSIMTMRVGEIGFVAPFRYTAMVWAILMGILIFGEWPDAYTITGTAVIVITGLYSFHRERLARAKA